MKDMGLVKVFEPNSIKWPCLSYFARKKTSWGTMYNVCTCIQSHTCLGWGPDLQSSFECYWWLKLDEGKIKIENWSLDKMLRTFTILMLGLFQADASIWFVNYEKYILGFQPFGVILTFIISSHSQWNLYLYIHDNLMFPYFSDFQVRSCSWEMRRLGAWAWNR